MITDSRDALSRFVALAREGQRMKLDEFQASEGAAKAIATLNVEMYRLRLVLRNAGYSIPMTNDVANEDIDRLAALAVARTGSALNHSSFFMRMAGDECDWRGTWNEHPFGCEAVADIDLRYLRDGVI